jgi:hypothetical protein
MRKQTALGAFALAAFLVATVWSAPAEAQRRGFGHRPGVRIGVVFGGARLYNPWFQGRYPYPYPYPFPPYGYGRMYDDATSALRIQVTPRQADVYVDGFRAGVVDDFDGVFQRLHVRPGGHEIVLFLEGYRTVRQNLYLSPNSTQNIKLAMERLRPGETSGPRPVPPPPPIEEPAPTGAPGQMRPGEPLPPGIRAGPQRPMPTAPEPAPAPEPQPAPQAPLRNGTLAIRVQPADADVFIDGEKWTGPATHDRLLIQLGEGKHKLELKKAGYDTFSADVMVRPAETTTVNVTLSKSGS